MKGRGFDVDKVTRRTGIRHGFGLVGKEVKGSRVIPIRFGAFYARERVASRRVDGEPD